MIARASTSAELQATSKPSRALGGGATVLGLPRLLTCPRCEYSLLGLPRRHCCPECGLQYDEFSCEWERSRRWTPGEIVSNFMIVFVGAMMWAGFVITGVVGMPLVHWLFLFAGIIHPGLLMAYFFRRKRRRFVAVTPEGVAYRVDMWKPKTIPWHKIVEVRQGGIGTRAGAVLSCRRGLSRCVLLNSPAEAEEFVSAVNDGRRRYPSDAPMS